MKRITEFLQTTRFKTTLWYSLLFLMLEIIIGLTVYYYMYRSLSEQLDKALVKQTTAILEYFSEKDPGFDSFKPDSVYQAPDELVWDIIYEAVALNPRNTYIQIEFKNKVIYRSDNLKQKRIHLEVPPSKEVKLLEFYNPKISAHSIRTAYIESNYYQIIVAFPVGFIAETLEYLTNIYFLMFPFFFVLAVAGGALISAKALSRIDSIIKKTDEITINNLDETIKGEEYNDEYGRLVKQINGMIARIKNSFNYLNQFSIAVSHELKTPLTILRGEIEVALKSPKTSDEYRKILESNYEETLRLSKIVDSIFYISRMDRSLIQFKMNELPLNQFLQKVVDSVEILGRDKGIDFRFEPDKDVRVQIDENQLRQAFYHLFDNAVKYGYEKTSVIISTTVLSNTKQVAITIMNIGETISSESLSKLFEPFYRSENAKESNVQGVGLGLSVVKSIIEMHNGLITINSVDGKTIFTLYLNYV